MSSASNHIVSAGAAGATISTFTGSILGWVPPIVTIVVGILAAVWYIFAIYESATFQGLIKGREYVRLRKRQVAAAKVLAAAQQAQAKALAAYQEAEAKALAERQKAGVDPSTNLTAPALPGSEPPTPAH